MDNHDPWRKFHNYIVCCREDGRTLVLDESGDPLSKKSDATNDAVVVVVVVVD